MRRKHRDWTARNGKNTRRFARFRRCEISTMIIFSVAPTEDLRSTRWSAFLLGCTVWNDFVRASAKIASVTIGVFGLVVLAVSYSTARGYMSWWFRCGGSVQVDGVKNGYLHKNWSGTAVIITLTDLKPSESYFVSLLGSKYLLSCGNWHAPRFFPFAFGDINPPCLLLHDEVEAQRTDLPDSSTASIQPGSIEFSTKDGRKVTASW